MSSGFVIDFFNDDNLFYKLLRINLGTDDHAWVVIG